MNEVERLEEKMKSKNWKERQEAYNRLGDFVNEDEYTCLISLIQNESNIPALESGIDAILKASHPPAVETVFRIFSHIGNLKTTVRARVLSLIDFIAQEYTEGVVREMVSLVNSKTPKTVSGAVGALVDITDKYDVDLHIVGGCLKQIFGHADKSVRAEGTRLCVVLFKKFGNEIRQYIKDVKPIQLKELEEEFSKFHLENEIVENKTNTSSKSLKKCNDEKWNIRLKGLTELKACIPFIVDSETLGVLYSIINDPNNQVFFELLEILAAIKLKNQRIVNGLVERLKDKKTVVCEKIKDTLLKMDLPEEFIQKDFFTHKNPQVKINIIDYVLKRGLEKKEIVEWVRGCTKDQSAQVRNKANEYLQRVNNNKAVPTPIKRVKKDLNSDESIVNKVKDVNKSIKTSSINCKVNSSYNLPTQEKKENVLDSFYFKYPFFKEKMWNVRLEAFRKNTPLLLKEDIRDLMVFFLSHKENIFQLNLAHFDILIQRKGDLESVSNLLMVYSCEKITENKLQAKIVEVLRLVDQKECVSFLKKEIKNIKQGKKLVCLLWLLGELITKGNCEIEEILTKSVTGINEKKAIEGLKQKLEECKLKDDEFSGEYDYSKGDYSKDDYNKDGVDDVEVIDNGDNQITKKTRESDFVTPKTNLKPSPITFPLDLNLSHNQQTIPNLAQSFSESIKETRNVLRNNPPIQTQNSVNNMPVQTQNIANNLLVQTQNTVNLTPVQTQTMKIVKTNTKQTKKEDVFTPEFLRCMKEMDFNTIVDLFSTTDRILISNFVIDYYVDKKLASSYFNSLILYFISEKYILQEAECLVLITYLLENNMKEELKMMDRIYPVTKLFFVLQKINTDEAFNEILRLIDSYKMFRGDKKKFIEKLKQENKQALKKAVRECLDLLSFIDEIDEQYCNENKKGGNKISDNKIHEIGSNFKRTDKKMNETELTKKRTDKDTNFGTKDTNYVNKDTNFTNQFSPFNTPIKKPSTHLVAPSVLEDPFNQNDIQIESSLQSLSIHNTPNLHKFRKEFESPIVKRHSVDSLEEILDNLIDSNQEKSKKAFMKLSDLVEDNMSSLLFSANSIISSISIQLLDVLHRPLYATLILNVLLKLSKSQVFCEQLRVETLESVNSDLITMFDSLNKDNGSTKDHVQLVLDIITNLSLNCKPLMAIQVYLNLFSKGGNRDVYLRLIWRHSKCLNKLSLEDIEGIIDVFEKFYTKHIYSPFFENRTTFKMLILHIGQIVLKYPKEIERLPTKGYTKILIGLYKAKSSIRLEDLRSRK